MWGLYVQKRGTLNLGMRMEYLMARLSFQVAGAMAGKGQNPKWKDYLRFHDMEPEKAVTPLTPAQQAQMFASRLNAGRK